MQEEWYGGLLSTFCDFSILQARGGARMAAYQARFEIDKFCRGSRTADCQALLEIHRFCRGRRMAAYQEFLEMINFAEEAK